MEIGGIKKILTKPNIHQERKVLISIGEDNCNIDVFKNRKLWKYGDIYCYHPNIWKILPNMEIIAFYWINSEEALKSLENNKGKVHNIICTMKFITEHNLLSRKEELGFSGVIPIEDIIKRQQPYYYNIIDKLKQGTLHPRDITYPLSLTLERNYIYHFETEKYEEPEYMSMFTNNKIYWALENEEPFNKYFAPIYLFQQYYVPKNRDRRKEINYCIKRNIRSGFFDKIVMLNEQVFLPLLLLHLLQKVS